MASESDAPRPGDLATRSDFRIGGLEVSPSAGRARIGDQEVRVEPRVMEVLIVLWENAGRSVSRDRLIELCWGGRVVSDDAVNRIIAKVRGLSRLHDPPPFTLETLPKIGFRLTAGAGVEAGVGVGGDAAAGDELVGSAGGADGLGFWRRVLRRRGVALGGLAGLLALIGVVALVANWPAGRVVEGWVEVAPMQVASDDAEVRRVGGRVDETIVRFLPSLGIRTAAADAPGATWRGARAEFRIAGVVDRRGDVLVANGQILEPQSGLLLWSGVYERGAGTPDGFEEAFSSFVTGVLACALDQRAHETAKVSVQVFSQLLDVCEAVVFQRRDGLEPARDLMRAAPTLAVSHAMLAGATLNDLDIRGGGERELDETLETAETLAERSLAIAADQPIGHISLARIAMYRGALAEAERRFRMAIEIDPDLTPTVVIYAGFLQDVGRLDEARQISERAATMADPRLVGFGPSLAFLQAMAGDMDAARRTMDRVARIEPDFAGPLAAYVDFWWGAPSADAAGGAGGGGDVVSGCFGEVLTQLDAPDAARSLPPACAGEDVLTRMRLLSRLGLVDEAYAAFAQAPAAEQRYTSALFGPEMAAFRADARFAEVAERLGLAEYWRETGSAPDFCRRREAPQTCARLQAHAAGEDVAPLQSP